MNDFEEYFKAGEPGRRERAEAWATAIGLQQVDGLVPSQFLFNTAIEHIFELAGLSRCEQHVQGQFVVLP